MKRRDPAIREARRREAQAIEEQRRDANLLAWREILDKDVLPAWMRRNMSGDLRHEGGSIWTLDICLFKKIKLKEGYYWEKQSDGSKTMRRTDPVTGEESVVILYDVPDEGRVSVCEIEVNTGSRQVVVREKTDLSDLNPGDWELFYE